MKQAELVATKTIEIKDVPKPEITAGQALLKVHAVGICGSDIHAWHGAHPFVHAPVVMGHEATGEVVEVGADVKNVKVGERVIFRPQDVCGECIHCKSGRYNICNSLKVLGCQSTGASGEFYAVDADLLYQLPDNIDYAAGTVIEPLAVGVHAAKIGLPGGFAGKKALVIGAGTIGNAVAQAARGLGIKNEDIIITDVSEFKLGLAKKCGFVNAINVKDEDLAQVVLDKFGPDGADVVYECTASENGLNQVLQLARKGTRIVIVGVYGHKVNLDFANVQDREYELVGTLMYVDEDYVDAIRLVRENKVDLSTLVTNEFPLEQTGEAFEYIEKHKDDVQKVVIKVN